jgi:hypothetical protein
LYFQLPYLLEEKKPVFSKRDLLTTGRYQPACHYLSKNEKKIPSLLYVGKGPEYDLLPASGTDLKITEILSPFSYTKFGIIFFRFPNLSTLKLF